MKHRLTIAALCFCACSSPNDDSDDSVDAVSASSSGIVAIDPLCAGLHDGAACRECVPMGDCKHCSNGLCSGEVCKFESSYDECACANVNDPCSITFVDATYHCGVMLLPNGALCDAGHECFNGKCESCTTNGKSCFGNSAPCCASLGLQCYFDVCKSCTSDSAACATDADCCSGICDAGLCKALDCTPPEASCGSYCANKHVDSNNCGSCGSVCDAGQTCANNACVP